MRIINTATNETVATVMTNHGMTLDEALELIDAEIHPEYAPDADVKIGRHWYWYDDLETAW